MRFLVCWLALVAASLVSGPVRAEVVWHDVSGAYQLTGAQIFRLRDTSLAPDTIKPLGAIRNVSFPDEASFREAVKELLAGVPGAQEAEDLLAGLAGTAGASFGIETRDGDVATILVTGSGRELDTNAFTAKSWLKELPPPVNVNAIGARMDGGCLAVTRSGAALFRLCQPEIGDPDKAVLLETAATHIVGLGQEFQIAGDTTVERGGFVRHGFNVMSGFNGGANGNTLFPIAYFDLDGRPFALILDNRYQQEWDFSQSPYRLRVWGGDLRLHVLTGDTLADLRRQFMALSGHPPVPPKAMFGLWISEYGYESWDEVDARIASLRAAGFPLSGVVLDLFWFGGIKPSSLTSRMGSLTWDETRFPNPAAKIAAYAADGIGVMLIEESYISAGLPEHTALAERNALAHDDTGAPVLTNPAGNWWGRGGMVDWTTAEARDFWHDYRRQALVDMGVIGHWTDLGEPEMVSPGFRYSPSNMTEAQVHQSYNVLWLEGIFDGYRRNAPEKRPFMMSRSGGMGMQTLGAAMWSGDTGGDFGSLAAQMAQQTHMMWSGVDYYGSDIGGFHRAAMGAYPGTHEELTDELYTQWLAYAALFEVPVRPHTENLCNCKDTSPDRIGHVPSNLANLRLRYELLPYYYSLAHRAWLTGEPVFPSLEYADPAAPNSVGNIKLVGPGLIAAAVAQPGAMTVEVVLPAQEDAFDFRTGEAAPSHGHAFSVPLHRDGLFQLPVFARDGAIVPMADGSLRVFGTRLGSFDWYDDDGWSTAYQSGTYEQLAVSIDSAEFFDSRTLRLKRIRGTAIQPTEVWWAVQGKPLSVQIDGTSVEFRREGGFIVFPLPAFDDALDITLSLGVAGGFR